MKRRPTEPMKTSPSGFPAFVTLWSGQSLSLLGSELSAFALGVYVFQLTGSVTALGLVYVLAFLPLVVVSPVAGSLVDRWGAGRALLVSNLGSMLLALTLAALLVTDAFAVWQVYVIVHAMSILAALQLPAFAASVPLLVPKRHIGRANGMRLVATAASQVLAPVTAGVLLQTIAIEGIVLIDCLSFGLAVLILLPVRVPRAGPEQAAAGGSRTLLADFAEAWRYVAARPGLVALLAFLGSLSLSGGFVEVLITPLVLSFTSSDALGVVMTIGALGMVATGLATSVWGGPRRRVRGLLGCSLLLAVATVVGSLRPSVPMIAAAAFLFLGGMGIIFTCNQSIWQTKVEPRLLGRVMALQNMTNTAPQLLAYALAGPLVDHLLHPLVGRDEVRSPFLARLLGDGPGRGIALLLMLVGLLIAASVAVAWLHPRLRHLEDELPDAAPADAEEPVADHPVAAPADAPA